MSFKLTELSHFTRSPGLRSYFANSSESAANTKTRTQSFSETLEPIIKREPGAYYSLEEQKQMFKDLIIKLPNRHAFAVLSNQTKSVPFKTQTVDDEYFSETHLGNLVKQQYLNSPSCLIRAHLRYTHCSRARVLFFQSNKHRAVQSFIKAAARMPAGIATAAMPIKAMRAANTLPKSVIGYTSP